jgi:5-bromo-4-chloroindolyl phosphate hydrolysis protein
MTAKEKAIELVEKFKFYSHKSSWDKKDYCAIECALITVDELIGLTKSLMVLFNEDRSEFEAIELDYLEKVKSEIEKL